MIRRRQVAAFILAGGASSRMGRDKGLLDFGGIPLIVHTVRVIEPLVACVTVVGAPRRYAATGLRTITDQGAANNGSRGIRRGPLAGIAAALAETRSPWNLIVACDLPYLSAAWVDWLLSRAIRSRGEVVIPRTGRGFEPLAAVYRRECGAVIAAALARGGRKVTDVIIELRMDVIDRSKWRAIDPRGLVLKNMNTPRAYDAARKWWNAERLRESHSLEMPRQARKQKSRFVVLQNRC